MRRSLTTFCVILAATVTIGKCGDTLVGYEPDLLRGEVVEWVLSESAVGTIQKFQSFSRLNELRIGDFIDRSLKIISADPSAGVFDRVPATIEGDKSPPPQTLVFEAVDIREVDLGRTKENPFGSASEGSEIYVVTIHLRSTESYASCRVVFLHTGEIVMPVRRALGEVEKQMLSDMAREVERDSE